MEIRKPTISDFTNAPHDHSSAAQGGVIATGTTISAISGNTNAVKNMHYVMTANLTLTLPGSPAVNDLLMVSNMSGVTTCVIARNGENIMGLAQDFTYEKLNVTSTFKYSGATYGWLIM